METATTSPPFESKPPARAGVGLRHLPLALFSPRRFASRVEDVACYGWALVVLLAGVTLVGYATVQTGLIDREVERAVRQRIAAIDMVQRDVVERSELRDLYLQEEKQGQFERLIAQMQAVAVQPLSTLFSILGIAAMVYGVVALSGRKPEWNTLMNLCVFSAYTDLLRLVVTFGLMVRLESLEVYTSLAPLGTLLASRPDVQPQAIAAVTGALSAVDPFRMWFWIVLAIGLSRTAQLPRWRAWTLCILCWLVTAGIAAGIMAVSQMAPTGGT